MLENGLCSSCGNFTGGFKSITYVSSIHYVSIIVPSYKLILTPLLYNYCAIFVRKDRCMHILYINVLKNDSIVGYVVFDFDLLLSDDKGFKYSTNYNSNNKDKD